jgi:hypothetical protein
LNDFGITTNDSIQVLLEESMKRIHHESYDQWINNFALNLDKIWVEPSARELISFTNNESVKKEKSSAIVIGRGPSIKKFGHLELLKESNYEGSIICCDGALIDTLKAGVTPDKFPNFYVATIDPISSVKKYYDDEIVDKYGSQIKGAFTIISHPSVVNRARQAGIKIHWFHSLFDYNEGKKSFNHISALIVRAKNHLKGLPAIQTGGNVGTSSWFIAWKILKCSDVALIGLNHGWEEDDPLDLIMRHGLKHLPVKVEKNNPAFKKLFPKIFNPEIGRYCILDPIFQFYSTAFKEFILRSPSWLTTINATEGGSLFGERIKWMAFNEFLKNY